MTECARNRGMYGVFGVLFGACFPAAALAIDIFWLRGQWAPLSTIIVENPLHMIILMAPFVLGAVFFVLGLQHDRRAALFDEHREKNHFFQRMVEGVSDYAIYMIDSQGLVMSWNKGAMRFKGYEAAEIIGSHVSVFFPEEDRNAGAPQQALARAVAEGSFEAEGWRIRKDGTRFWAQVVIDPIHDDRGRHIGFAKITRDRTEQKTAEDRIRHLARHDTLTGLPNRKKFREELDMNLAEAEREGEQVAVVAIDLDRFKEINDTFGHSIGDEVLCVLSDRLRSRLEAGEMIGRFGGDEFVAMKPYKSTEALQDFIQRLETALCETMPLEVGELTPGASLGVAIFPLDARDSDKLLNNADMAMYRAKEALEERVCYYEASMDEAERDRRLLAKDIWTGLKEEQFFLNFQVQRAADDHRPTGYEVLLRWRHPTRGMIPPAIFIPIAEECGAISALGEWVLEKACSAAAAWQVQEKIAVNLSPLQLTNVNLVARVKEILIKTGLPPARLELEVTESAIIADKQRALHILRQIKAMGVTIAMDDFGTGYSSLETLRSFPFDKIKLDRSFVRDLEVDRQSRAFVRAILALGKSLSIPVLAEGVETEAQADLLTLEGCDQFQGFFFGRPSMLNDVMSDEQEERKAG